MQCSVKISGEACLRLRLHGITVSDDNLYIISYGTIIESTLPENNKDIIAQLFLALTREIEIENTRIRVRGREYELDQTDTIRAANYLAPSLGFLELLSPVPALPYFDGVVGRPAVAVPAWFREEFERECRPCTRLPPL